MNAVHLLYGVGGILALAFLFWVSRRLVKSGGDAVEKAIGERDLEAAARIAEGAADNSDSRDDRIAGLRDGGRKL